MVRKMEGQESEPFEKEHFDELSKKVLNGRQIKNAVKTAQSCARMEGCFDKLRHTSNAVHMTVCQNTEHLAVREEDAMIDVPIQHAVYSVLTRYAWKSTFAWLGVCFFAGTVVIHRLVKKHKFSPKALTRKQQATGFQFMSISGFCGSELWTWLASRIWKVAAMNEWLAP
ncbi:uncharacterized protein BDR25DRAFT_350423 [Lindgomyces ingoldianus]|uniref:Uncharacterized protein n=1 Tax=Lindgomyces ingoldianus TaxID=673940 RepID=A0ACB6RA39_9PLEO|nr:uncharacterized protein BDR25DRAFT_350423 [Lindgomyces ingoldianus]KAF2476129.1 hypothetical protein BDR25DRAFT_350423 [Lindgomyces ingoldianus]